jgi:flagellin
MYPDRMLIMLSIQTNVSSLLAQENLRLNSEFQSQTIERVTSGFRINQSGDDAAGLVVANGYRSSVAELTQGVRNANDGLSTLQIIDGGLKNLSKVLDRLKTLATESASDTFTGDRTILDGEYQDLIGEIDRQADNIGLGSTTTTWTATLSVYIGGNTPTVSVDLSGGAVDSGTLGLATDITSATNATSAIGEVNGAIQTLGTVQGTVGSGQNKLAYATRLAQSQISSFSAAESRLRDADMAAEAANLTKAQVLQQASLAAMAQANAAPQAVLALLKG